MTENCYVHIPFCRSKCKYCSFVSFPRLEMKDLYLKALRKDIQTHYKNEELNTLYFGGGTPSILTVEEFLTIYRIISDLNLSNLQAQRSIAYLQTEGMPIVQYPQMNNQGYQRVQYQQPSYQPQQYKPRQVYQPRQAYQQVVDQQPSLYQQNREHFKPNPVEQKYPTPQYSQPAPHIVQKQQPQQNQLPPREQEKAPIMNFSAVESTPVDYDDDAAIDAIFNGSEN